MRSRMSGMLALAAGAVIVPCALAQEATPVDPGTLTMEYVRLRDTGYGERAIAPVWDTPFSSTANGSFFGRPRIVEDFNFNPGPWATTQGNAAQIEIGRAHV